jgi:ribonuclease P protein component
MTADAHTLRRHERLKSRKLIGAMFAQGGQSYVAHPFRVTFLPLPADHSEAEVPAQLAISVPKRTFKTAVARNRIKRLIREAYRLHKPAWYAHLAAQQQRVAVMLLFLGKTEPTLAEVEAGIGKMIRKFPAPMPPNHSTTP